MVRRKVVIDSNIFIDHLRLSQKSDKKSQLELLIENKNVIPLIASTTIQELFAGQSSKKIKEEGKIKKLLTLFKQIPIDSKIAKLAGKIIRDTKKVVLVADAQIAAVAILTNSKLLTNNKKDFKNIKGIKFF